ncbi:HupE/UreJ family protein [Parasphingorhabdus sp.]|uniref:HupE/UreJ family protein n=1 Tax=Parasphingorhabdus sp. TaxID=2709688 RepID=UPI003A934A7F
MKSSEHSLLRGALALWLLALILAMLASPATAHEIRPAALTISEQADGNLSVIWKQPVLSGRKLRMRPILPEQCAPPEQTQQEFTGTATVESWQTACRLDRGEIRIEGLEQTLTDVFVRVKFANGSELTRVLRPASTGFSLANESGNSPASAYLRIGAEHMLFGWDHLLFVLGLLLLTPVRRILWVITAFTAGHSLTLAITALGLFRLPSGPVELLIALSIFFLAVEVVRKQAGKTSFTIRQPWVVAMAFGLLHGLGFAGALSEIGLPRGQEIWALLLFNLGVEIGQILFVAAVLAGYWLISRLPVDRQNLLFRPALYLVGSLGAYFTMTRIFI